MRCAFLVVIACAGCAQSTRGADAGQARDLSAFVIDDLSSHDADSSSSTDLACRQLSQGFATTPTGWSLLGSTVMDTPNLRLLLTNDYEDKAGTAFYVTAVPFSHFEASFKYYIGDGSGGEGLAFVLAKATGLAALAPTGTGSKIGYVGMDGFAVELDTAAGGTGDPGANHVAWTRANTGAHLLTATPPFPLHCGCERQARIRVVNDQLTVTIDNIVVLDGAVPDFVPDTYYFGFAAATGGNDDRHAVRDFKLAIGAVGAGCGP